MEEARNNPVCITTNAEEQFLSSCSVDDKSGEWQELEKYWGGEKHRVQDFDGVKTPMSNSLEKHLMYDDYINEPLRNGVTKGSLEAENDSKMVNGININDIPASYNITGFEAHELIVIGTYVDKNVVPGFQYKVRKNFSEDYLFDGQALTLESIGLGYGKRLTFQGHNLNKNTNYFWSDSHKDGYGLTFQAVSPDTVFRIIDTKINKDIGRITVNDPARSVDAEIATEVRNNGQIHKTVRVHFSGDVILSNSCSKQNIFHEDMDIHGTAVLHRADLASKAKIKEIVLQNFVVDDCLLVPEE